MWGGFDRNGEFRVDGEGEEDKGIAFAGHVAGLVGCVEGWGVVRNCVRKAIY